MTVIGEVANSVWSHAMYRKKKSELLQNEKSHTRSRVWWGVLLQINGTNLCTSTIEQLNTKTHWVQHSGQVRYPTVCLLPQKVPKEAISIALHTTLHQLENTICYCNILAFLAAQTSLVFLFWPLSPTRHFQKQNCCNK